MWQRVSFEKFSLRKGRTNFGQKRNLCRYFFSKEALCYVWIIRCTSGVNVNQENINCIFSWCKRQSNSSLILPTFLVILKTHSAGPKNTFCWSDTKIPFSHIRGESVHILSLLWWFGKKLEDSQLTHYENYLIYSYPSTPCPRVIVNTKKTHYIYYSMSVVVTTGHRKKGK